MAQNQVCKGKRVVVLDRFDADEKGGLCFYTWGCVAHATVFRVTGNLPLYTHRQSNGIVSKRQLALRAMAWECAAINFGEAIHEEQESHE